MAASGEGEAPASVRNDLRVAVAAVLLAAVTVVHFRTEWATHHYHVVYDSLYLLPVILSALWFGLRGGLLAALVAVAVNAPYAVRSWSGFSSEDVNNALEIGSFVALGVLVGTLRDRQRRQEAELRRGEALAAVGWAVTALAHDLRGPAAAIGGLVRQVRDGLPGGGDRDKLAVVIEEAGRLERMTGEMLEFAGPIELRSAPVDLPALVERGRRAVEPQALRRNVGVRVRAVPGMEPLTADGERLLRALVNVLANAVEASPEGTDVEIEVSADGRAVVIDVTDRGPGVPPGLREEIFTPFFTTKPGGTGLGLAIVRRIVEAHGGSVIVVEGPEGGARFRIIIPRT